MSNENIYKDAAIMIKNNAPKKNYKVMANIIYFIIKQYPEHFGQKNRMYVNLIKNIRTGLVEDFGWSLIDFHKCLCELNRLTIYIQ